MGKLLALLLMASWIGLSCSGSSAPGDADAAFDAPTELEQPAQSAAPVTETDEALTEHVGDWLYSSSENEYSGPVVGALFNEFILAFDAETGVQRRLADDDAFLAAYGYLGTGPFSPVARNREAMFAIAQEGIENTGAGQRLWNATLTRVDLVTGEVTELADLGPASARPSAGRQSHAVEAVTEKHVLVSLRVRGDESSEVSFQVFDAVTGDLISETADIRVCDGSFQRFVAMADGNVAVQGWWDFALLDLDSATVSPVGSCEPMPNEIGEVLATEPVETWITTATSAQPTAEMVASLQSTTLLPNPRIEMVAGGGYLWWVSSFAQGEKDEIAVAPAAVQYDLELGEIVNVWPVANDIWLDCSGRDCEERHVVSLGWADGHLIAALGCCNSELLVLDVETGKVQTVPLVGFPSNSSMQIIDHPPGPVWLLVHDDRGIQSWIAELDLEAMVIEELAEIDLGR